jgi:hypothetical protein
MERDKRIKSNTENLLNSNIANIYYNYNNDSLSERKKNNKQPEMIIKNLEPKDNIKKANHRRLINSENEEKLELDLKYIKLNENKQIKQNNLYDKKDAKSLTEFNSKKTFGFFNKEKEIYKENEDIIKKKENTSLNLKDFESNSRNKNNKNVVNDLQVLSLDFNNINNNIEFNDNKIVHIKRIKKIKLIKTSILEQNQNLITSIPDGSINDNQHSYIKTELNNEKLPLDNMRNKLRREIKLEKENKINKIKEDKNEKKENTKEPRDENKIIKIEIVET